MKQGCYNQKFPYGNASRSMASWQSIWILDNKVLYVFHSLWCAFCSSWCKAALAHHEHHDLENCQLEYATVDIHMYGLLLLLKFAKKGIKAYLCTKYPTATSQVLVHYKVSYSLIYFISHMKIGMQFGMCQAGSLYSLHWTGLQFL